MINTIMNINKIIIRDVNLSFNINDFFQEFIDITMISLIDFFLKYD